MKKRMIVRMLCAVLALCMLAGSMIACSKEAEVPDGYQYATCKGEYFRLFVPTQWNVNTESGVSGAYYSLAEGTADGWTIEAHTPSGPLRVSESCPHDSRIPERGSSASK